MAEFSGPQWCQRFPGSVSVDDLIDPFKSNLQRFLDALDQAGASVEISATYRPPERAYLMHWCCAIQGYKDKQGVYHVTDPADVSPMAGVDIDWTCGGDHAKARNNAAMMVRTYKIRFPAALVSRHTQRRAVDMTIQWWTQKTFLDADGAQVTLGPNDLEGLVPIGASYGVIKLVSDPPHWSDDGH